MSKYLPILGVVMVWCLLFIQISLGSDWPLVVTSLLAALWTTYCCKRIKETSMETEVMERALPDAPLELYGQKVELESPYENSLTVSYTGKCYETHTLH